MSSGDGPKAVRKEEVPFEVRRSSVAPATEVQPSAALEGVQAGKLDVKGYVDAKVTEATAHLTHLSDAQREVVQRVVRGQLMADPHLAELVHHATGSPVPQDEE